MSDGRVWPFLCNDDQQADMKDLTHANPQKVRAALELAQKKGDATWIMPLLAAFASREEDALREEMRQMLSSLKLSAAEALFLESLKDRELAHVHADILGFLWSCGFTCENHLALIAEVACQGDFRQAMEGCTLIEQVESVQNEKDLLEAQVIVSQVLQDGGKKSVWPFAESMSAHLMMLSDTMA